MPKVITAILIAAFISGCSLGITRVAPPAIVQAPPEAPAKAPAETPAKAASESEEPPPGVCRVQVICDRDKAIEAGKYEIPPEWAEGEAEMRAKYPELYRKSDENKWANHLVEPGLECKAGQRDIELYNVSNREVHGFTPSDILSQVDQAGFRPATEYELLALGYTCPDLQMSRLIVALGTKYEHNNHEGKHAPISYVTFPNLSRAYDARTRGFSTYYHPHELEYKWPVPSTDEGLWRPASDHYFAVVRK